MKRILLIVVLSASTAIAQQSTIKIPSFRTDSMKARKAGVDTLLIQSGTNKGIKWGNSGMFQTSPTEVNITANISGTNIIRVADTTALKAISSDSVQMAYLVQSGREGMFIKKAKSNFPLDGTTTFEANQVSGDSVWVRDERLANGVVRDFNANLIVGKSYSGSTIGTLSSYRPSLMAGDSNAMQLVKTGQSVFVGNTLAPVAKQAGNSTLVGGYETGLRADTLTDDTFIGQGAGRNYKGGASNSFHNTFAGVYSGDSLVRGMDNSLFGVDIMGRSYGSAYAGQTINAVTAGGVYTFLYNRQSNNTAFGYAAASLNTTGIIDAFGSGAAQQNTTGIYNWAFGRLAMRGGSGFITGDYNGALANGTLFELTTGSRNFAAMQNALSALTTSSDVISIGYNSMQSKVSGTGRTVNVGNIGLANATGGDHVNVGYGGMGNLTSGDGNTNVGKSGSNASGAFNYRTSVGSNAFPLATGDFVSGVGSDIGATLTTGTRNTLAGNESDVARATISYGTALGYRAIVQDSNSVTLGGVTVNKIDFANGAAGIMWGAGNPSATKPIGFVYIRTDAGATDSLMFISRGGGTWIKK